MVAIMRAIPATNFNNNKPLSKNVDGGLFILTTEGGHYETNGK
jgi:hypothetical protein